MHTNKLILYSTVMTTPLGSMMAIADRHYLYVLQFVDHHELEQAIHTLQKKLNANIIPGHTTIFDLIQKELNQFFAGRLHTFTTPLHFSGSAFQQLVWSALQKIPYGTTQSYAQLARTIGNAAACRAVAQANGANHLVIIIPCHRIINANGKLEGYSSGISRKQWLLNHENNQGIL